MLGALRRARQRRILSRNPIADDAWQGVLQRLPLLANLGETALRTLRELCTLFVAEKTFVGARGMQLDDDMRLLIAAQGCLPILNLGIDAYRGWRTVVVYPEAFLVELTETDDSGLVHHGWQERAGEAWERGAVILSWQDILDDLDHGGYSVVIHELAHKLDMLNDGPNGCPPLHAGMDPRRWAAVMQDAFDALNAAVDRGEETLIDPYAAEAPEEFFAVATEHFFLDPELLRDSLPEVYRQLSLYYLQDPATRLPN